MLKAVIIVRKDLGMSTGKVVAQCAHGLLDMYRGTAPGKLTHWQQDGETIITLKTPTDSTLGMVAQGAQRYRVPTYTVVDKMLGVKTVCVVGPANSDKIDKFTYALKLL